MSNGFVGPRRSDPSGKYESPWGDIRNVGSPFAKAGGAAVGAAAGFPWSIIIPIVISLMGGMFGDEEDEYGESMRRGREGRNIAGAMGLKQPYQSPYLPGIDKTVMQALMNSLQRTSNWGWPAGKQMDTSFIEQMLSSMSAGGVGGSRVKRRIT